jgi:chemotaxis protein MotB
MSRWLAVLLLLVLVAIGAAYLWLYEPQRAALDEASRLLLLRTREIDELRGRLADLEVIRDRLKHASADLREQVAAKEAELAALRTTQDELVASLQQEIADHKVQVERVRDSLRVDMVDELLFDSGEADLKPAGIEVLRRVGAVLVKTPGRRFEVQGHTDNVPIRGALARRFPTNWELSAARAINVVRFLQEETGIDATRLHASAHSEYRPKETNETEEGRRRNRRIEILLGPAPLPEEPTP